MKARVESGWVSRAYGERQAAPVAVIESEGAGKRDFTSFIIPESAGVSPASSGIARIKNQTPIHSLFAESSAGETPTLPGRVYQLNRNDSLDVIITGDGASDIDGESMAARAELALARFVNQRFARACVTQGQRIEIKNLFALQSSALIRFAEIAAADGGLEITIHGASRFELSFSQPPVSVVVNGARFTVSPECASVAFALVGSGWTLMNRN